MGCRVCRRPGRGTRSWPGRAPGTTGGRSGRPPPRAAGGRPRARRRVAGAPAAPRPAAWSGPVAPAPGPSRSGQGNPARGEPKGRVEPGCTPARGEPKGRRARVTRGHRRSRLPCRPRGRHRGGCAAPGDDRSRRPFRLRTRGLGRAAAPGRRSLGHLGRRGRGPRAGGHPAAGPLPLHGRHDGRGLHALLPRAGAPRRRAQRRFPPPLWSGVAPRADGLVRRVRTLAGGRAHLRPLAAPRHHLRVVRTGPRVGSAGRHRRCRVRRLLRHDADRADRHGLERGARAHPVERGVRGPRAPPARRSPTAEMLARGRRAGRIGADLPARPDRRPRPRLRVAPLAVSGHPASGRARRRRRVHPDVGPPGDGRPRRGVPRHGAGPGVRAAGRAGAAPPAVVQPARRRVAGGGRGDPTVVAPPPPAGLSCLVLLVLRHAARHLRAGGVRRLAAPAARAA